MSDWRCQLLCGAGPDFRALSMRAIDHDRENTNFSWVVETPSFEMMDVYILLAYIVEWATDSIEGGYDYNKIDLGMKGNVYFLREDDAMLFYMAHA